MPILFFVFMFGDVRLFIVDTNTNYLFYLRLPFFGGMVTCDNLFQAYDERYDNLPILAPPCTTTPPGILTLPLPAVKRWRTGGAPRSTRGGIQADRRHQYSPARSSAAPRRWCW